MQRLAPHFPCLPHVHPVCSTQNELILFLSSPEPVPTSQTLHIHLLFLHTPCVHMGTGTHTPLSLLWQIHSLQDMLLQ